MSRHHAAAYRQRALGLEARGRSEEAVRAYRQTLRCDPDNADTQLRLGLLLRELGRDEEANQALASALRLRGASLAARPVQQVLTWAREPEPGAPAGAGSGNIER